MFDELASKSRDSQYLIDSTVMKAHRAASGAKGKEKSGDRRQPRRSNHEIPRDRRQQRPTAELTVTGGQVHDSQIVEKILMTPRSPLAMTAEKTYDSATVGQKIKDEGSLPIILNRCGALKKAYCPSAFTGRGIKSRTSSTGSKIGGASATDMKNSPAIS